MCCRLRIKPLDQELAQAILLTGLFQPDASGVLVRKIKEEGTAVYAKTEADSLRLFLMPAINSYAGHAGKRLAASVCFEIAARYAEKVNGSIHQYANVVGCAANSESLLLASYPEMPMQWERICKGFQEVLLRDGLG